VAAPPASQRDLLLYLRDFRWRDVDIPQQAPAVAEEHGTLTSPGEVAAPVVAADGQSPEAAVDLGTMAQALKGCRRCRLAAGRTQVVFGVGNPNARVMLIGEGPGAEEDRRGEPFVGRAGKLLNAMLRAMSLAREDVYIANVVKCRPPANRDPEADEAAACAPFLRRQIELINPSVIVPLGRIAAQLLLRTNAPMGSMHGRFTVWQGRDVLPLYHPAYLLRNPAAKAQVWAAMKLLAARLRGGA
jgi:uracil-DNA glycosylase